MCWRSMLPTLGGIPIFISQSGRDYEALWTAHLGRAKLQIGQTRSRVVPVSGTQRKGYATTLTTGVLRLLLLLVSCQSFPYTYDGNSTPVHGIGGPLRFRHLSRMHEHWGKNQHRKNRRPRVSWPKALRAVRKDGAVDNAAALLASLIRAAPTRPAPRFA
jgi:hypothetical protein